MGFPTKVQLINRKASEQWYINFPSAIAQAMEFSKGETVEWVIEDKALLALRDQLPGLDTSEGRKSFLALLLAQGLEKLDFS